MFGIKTATSNTRPKKYKFKCFVFRHFAIYSKFYGITHFMEEAIS